MSTRIFLYTSAIIFLLSFVACSKDKIRPEQVSIDCSKVSFAQDIQPLIQARCASCHTGNHYAGGSIDSYDGLKSKYDNGSLVHRVLTIKDMPMGAPLSETEFQKIKCWTESGAPNN